MLDTHESADGVATSVTVQPREIIEEVFRAFSAIGADPAEADEAGRAVLGAQILNGSGLRLLPALLQHHTRTPREAPSVEQTLTRGMTLCRLRCTGQPPLRTMLQLVDLACARSESGRAVVYTTEATPHTDLWADLLRRRGRALHRTITVLTPDGDLSVGTLDAESDIPLATARSLCPHGTAVIVATTPADHSADQAPSVGHHRPLRVSSTGWRDLQRAAHAYLASESQPPTTSSDARTERP